MYMLGYDMGGGGGWRMMSHTLQCTCRGFLNLKINNQRPGRGS